MQEKMYRIMMKKTNLYSRGDIKIKNMDDAFDRKGEFFANLKNLKIHVGHCKGKNDVLYNEYIKNCIIQECIIDTDYASCITFEELENKQTVQKPEIEEVKIENKKIIENSIVNDVATQVTEKLKEQEIIQTTSVSGSGNNAVY